MATYLPLALILVAAPLAPAAAHPAGHGVGLALENDGRIVVPVRINGAGPFRFRLDTGASRTVVTTRLVEQLNLPASGTSVLFTPTGPARSGLVRVEVIDTACGRAAPVVALALPAPALDDAGEVDGLVGQDVLAGLTYTIDYLDRRLWCHSRPAVVAGRSLPLSFTGGRAFVTLPGSDGRFLRLVPDTGADCLVLFTGLDAAWPLVTPLGIVQVRSVSGRRTVRRALVHGLGLGEAGEGGIDALLLSDQASGAMGDGLLPLRLFARVTFDGPGRQLVVERRR